MGPTLGGLLAGLIVLAIVLWPLERLFRRESIRLVRREGLGTDLAYWFFTPLVTRNATRLVIFAGVLVVARTLGVPLEPGAIQRFVSGAGRALQSQPLGLQIVEVLVLGDFVGYWVHRSFHRTRLWSFHAVHHSSRRLDWLSSVRVHPVNDLVARGVQVSTMLLLGFAPGLVAAFVPFLGLFGLFLHADVPWCFGPLRYVVASPLFHRWHHASEGERRGQNFAGLFPVWDLLFGTFHLPEYQPSRFGPGETPIPDGIVSQLVFPFRSRRRLGC